MAKINAKAQTLKKLNKPDYSLMLVIFALLSFGLVMVFSASSATAHYRFGDAYYFIKRQLIWAVLGVLSMLAISRISYKTIYKYTNLVMLISIILLLLVPIIGIEVNGAKRWLGFGGATFQPSEAAKFAIIIFMARCLNINKDILKSFTKGFLPYMAVIGIMAALVIIEPHFSGAMVVGIAGVIVLFAAGAKISHFMTVGVPIVILGVIIAFSASYRVARLESYWDPFSDISGDGYQIVQSLLAIGSGGFFGLGLGQSRQKFLYLPEPHNDFIFSVICEELGFIGASIVIILFALFVIKGIRIAIKAPDRFSALTTVGIVGVVAVQAILNIAVVTSTIPATGVPLPFFSYGGTSLMILLAEMGVLLSISRECEK